MVEQAIKKLPEMQQQIIHRTVGEKTTCPQWMAGEQLYNCENFTKTLRKAGFNLDRLFKQMRLSEQ